MLINNSAQNLETPYINQDYSAGEKKCQPIKTYFKGDDDSVNLRRHKKKYENPINSGMEYWGATQKTLLASLLIGGAILGRIALEDPGDFFDGVKKCFSTKRNIQYTTFAFLTAVFFIFLYQLPKKLYESRIKPFEKKKEYGIFSREKEIEKSLYAGLDKQAKTADDAKRQKLMEEFLQLEAAKKGPTGFVNIGNYNNPKNISKSNSVSFGSNKKEENQYENPIKKGWEYYSGIVSTALWSTLFGGLFGWSSHGVGEGLLDKLKEDKNNLEKLKNPIPILNNEGFDNFVNDVLSCKVLSQKPKINEKSLRNSVKWLERLEPCLKFMKKNAAWMGVGAGLFIFLLSLPTKLYKKSIEIFVNTKEMDVYSREQAVKTHLTEQIDQEEDDNKFNNYNKYGIARNGAGFVNVY